MNDFSAPLLDPDEQEHDSKMTPCTLSSKLFDRCCRKIAHIIFLSYFRWNALLGSRKGGVPTKDEKQGQRSRVCRCFSDGSIVSKVTLQHLV